MLAPVELYPAVVQWLQALKVVPHPAGLASLANLVTAVLVGQSLRCAALGRAQVSGRTVPARQRYLRVARTLARPWLSSAHLTPLLVRALLLLVRDPVPHLAMDTIRTGGWESITIGIVWHGRVVLVAWEVLPYPWPKGRFTPTVVQLLWRLNQSWPAERRPHLVADRGFPSLKLFRTLEQMGWGWTIRLRAKLTLGLDGEACALADLIAASRPGTWTCRAATYGTGAQRVAGHLVMGRGDALPLWPRHQMNPGSARARQRQWAARRREVAGKHPGRRTSTALQTDGWVLLFTSHPDWLPACQSYARRWATEASYRDGQGGYDGQHGWDLEPTLTRLTTATTVDHVLGLWALSSLLQTWVGSQVTHPTTSDAPPGIRAVSAQWTTSNRLSVWMRGRFAFTDRSGDLRPWLLHVLTHGALLLRSTAPPSTPDHAHVA